jgi:hypothetical protein
MMFAMINVPGDVEPLVISSQLSFSTRVSDLTSGHRELVEREVPGHPIGYAIRPQEVWEDKSLWITGTEIEFIGRVHNEGATGRLDGWTTGFIQSIYKLERNGHYDNKVVRELKLDTSFGPLTDGNAPPFYNDPKPFGPKRDSIKVEATDAPNFKLPLAYGPQHSLLKRTAGVDVFRTYLVLAREQDKSIVTLASIDWTISWDGEFEHKGETWCPDDAANFLKVVGLDSNPQLYAQLGTNHMNVPFSLKMKEAEKFCQISKDGTWMRCSMGGDVKNPKVPNLDTWRTHGSSM